LKKAQAKARRSKNENPVRATFGIAFIHSDPKAKVRLKMAESANGTGRVPVRDGTRIAYRLVKGSGNGRVVLIHSLAMDASFWIALRRG
jgi:hypothetical protein